MRSTSLASANLRRQFRRTLALPGGDACRGRPGADGSLSDAQLMDHFVPAGGDSVDCLRLVAIVVASTEPR